MLAMMIVVSLAHLALFTLAGHLMQIMGEIPVEGDSYEEGSLLFRVRRMEDRRIGEIEIIISSR